MEESSENAAVASVFSFFIDHSIDSSLSSAPPRVCPRSARPPSRNPSALMSPGPTHLLLLPSFPHGVGFRAFLSALLAPFVTLTFTSSVLTSTVLNPNLTCLNLSSLFHLPMPTIQKRKTKFNFEAVSLSVNCSHPTTNSSRKPAVVLSVLDPSSGNSPEVSTLTFKMHSGPLASSLLGCLSSSGLYCLCCSLIAADIGLSSPSRS